MSLRKPKHHAVQITALALLLVTALLTAQPARGADLKTQVSALKQFLRENGVADPDLAGPVNAFLAYLSELIDLRSELNSLNAVIGMAASFDNSRYSSSATSMDTALTKELYPSTLRFRAATKFIFSSQSVQNELTSILINYDYYLTPNIELYSFLERFSDSFMSIKQRYESGVGVKFEFDADPLRGRSSGGLSPAARSARNEEALMEAREKAELVGRYFELKDRFLASPLIGRLGDKLIHVHAILESIERDRRSTELGLEKKRSPFNLGLALSVFSEVEQADIDTDTIDPSTGENIQLLMDPVQLYRFTIRPSFNWKLSDSVTLSSQLYWKGSSMGFLKDARLDLYSKLDFRVAKDFLWGGPLSVSLDYQFHYDWRPPALPAAQVRDYAARGIALKYTAGEKYHHYMAIKFNVSL